MRSRPEHMQAIAAYGIPPIDLVCVNLYEFEKVAANQDAPLEELIENIDIGGPAMIPTGCWRRKRSPRRRRTIAP